MHKTNAGTTWKSKCKVLFHAIFCLLVGFSLSARLKYLGRSIPSVLPAVSRTPFSDQKNSIPSVESQIINCTLNYNTYTSFSVHSLTRIRWCPARTTIVIQHFELWTVRWIYLPVLWRHQQTQQYHSLSSCLETSTKATKVKAFDHRHLSDTQAHTVTRGYRW